MRLAWPPTYLGGCVLPYATWCRCTSRWGNGIETPALSEAFFTDSWVSKHMSQSPPGLTNGRQAKFTLLAPCSIIVAVGPGVLGTRGSPARLSDMIFFAGSQTHRRGKTEALRLGTRAAELRISAGRISCCADSVKACCSAPAAEAGGT